VVNHSPQFIEEPHLSNVHSVKPLSNLNLKDSYVPFVKLEKLAQTHRQELQSISENNLFYQFIDFPFYPIPPSSSISIQFVRSFSIKIKTKTKIKYIIHHIMNGI